eukprot:9094615-Pyramimonas_sp.AAC.1
MAFVPARARAPGRLRSWHRGGFSLRRTHVTSRSQESAQSHQASSHRAHAQDAHETRHETERAPTAAGGQESAAGSTNHTGLFKSPALAPPPGTRAAVS